MKRTCFSPVLVLVLLTLAACMPATTPVPPSDPSVVDEECVKPESDNSYYWSQQSCVYVSTTVYTVVVEVDDQIVNNTELNATGSAFVYAGYGSASYRMWQEGKGLLPVRVLSVIPALDWAGEGVSVILKTSDLKAMALPTGARVEFVCNLDTEVLSPVQNNQILTTDRQVYELDDCRMTTSSFSPPR